jgi:hypothetical protein
MQQINKDYSVRYSDSWSKNSAEVKRQQSPDGKHVRCGCCGKTFDWEQTQTHHLFYEKDEAGIPIERGGYNLVAVCGSTQDPGTCHHTLHSKKYYFHDPIDSVWGNKNTDEVIAKLQSNWVALRQEITGYPSTYTMPMQPQINVPPNTVVTTPQGEYSNQKIGDLAPGSEPSSRYRKELEDLAEKLAVKRLKQDKVSIPNSTKSLTKALSDLVIPLGVLIVILLTILIAL